MYNFLSFFQNAHDVTKQLATKEEEAPHIVIVGNTGTYIVGGGVIIDPKSKDFGVAITILMAVYYVWDLEYPRMYSQALGILQTFLFQEPYMMETSKNYKFLMKKFRKVFEEELTKSDDMEDND